MPNIPRIGAIQNYIPYLFRTRNSVKADLKRVNIRPDAKSDKLLRYYSEKQYKTVFNLVERARTLSAQPPKPYVAQRRIEIKDLAVDEAKDFPAIEAGEVPEEMLLECVRGETLDLRGLRQKLADRVNILAAGTPVPGSIPTVGGPKPRFYISGSGLGFLGRESTFFKGRLKSNPDTSLDKLFNKWLSHSSVDLKKIIGFESLVIYRPLEDGSGRWVSTHATRRFGESTFDPEKSGTFPDPAASTVGWLIVHGEPGKIYDVDIYDPETFKAAGITSYHPEKAKIDREQTKGDGRTLFIKIESAFGAEAVIQIHNRVAKNEATDPSPLLPGSEAEVARRLEILRVYFNDQVVNAINQIRIRQQAELKKREQPETTYELTGTEKLEILQLGELRYFQGQPVRLFESPARKFHQKLKGINSWLRDKILAVYEGTSIAEGKSKAELIAALSLQDELMNKRVTIEPSYTFLLQGPPGEEPDLRGIVSFSIEEVQFRGRRIDVLKVPEAMIRREARGKKMQVALTYEIGKRLMNKLFIEHGLFKGLWLAITKGVPIYATTQSKRVVRDLARLKDFSLHDLAKGRALNEEQRAILGQCSVGKADERGIELGAYGGRIAIDEEEQGIKVYNRKIDARVDELLGRLGTNGRMHLVGYLTLWVGLKTAVELWWHRLWGGRGRKGQ